MLRLQLRVCRRSPQGGTHQRQSPQGYAKGGMDALSQVLNEISEKGRSARPRKTGSPGWKVGFEALKGKNDWPIFISTFVVDLFRSKCSICDDVFWTDSLYKQHWKRCVAKWVKSSKYLEENASVEEQLIQQIQEQEKQQLEAERQQRELQLQQQHQQEQEQQQGRRESQQNVKREYRCAFCTFVFSTKEGYMEHTKHGQCVQVNKLELVLLN